MSFALGGPPRGSQSYASDLARRLRERDLNVFFSEDEAPPGSPLSETLRRALLRSKILVVVVNRGTLESPNWVRTEVQTFRSSRPGRPVIPICLDGSLNDPALSAGALPWLDHSRSIWLDEQVEAAARGSASEALVTRLLTAPHRLRANMLWRGLVGVVLASLLILAMLAAWQAVVAMQQRDRATSLRDQALSRQLAAQSLGAVVRDPWRALLLAVQSRAVSRTAASDAALLGAMSALPVARLQQHASAFEAVAVDPRSGMLVFADSRGAVFRGSLQSPGLEVVVELATGLNLYGAVKALAVAPDGRAWAHAGSSREITVRSAGTTRAIPDGDKLGESTPVFIGDLAFSPDGASIASVSTGRSLMLHDIDGGRSRLLHSAPVDLVSVAFSPDGRWVVAGGDREFLQAFAVAPGTPLPKFDSTAIGTVSALAFDASGRRLFAASRGGRFEVFDAATGRFLAAHSVPEQGALEEMAVSPDGRFVATGHGNGTVLLWWLRDGASRWTRQVLLRHAGAVRGLAFAADARTLVSVGQDGRVFVSLPVDQGRWRRIDQPPPASTTRMSAPGGRGALSPDGLWVAWAGAGEPGTSGRTIDWSGLASNELPRLSVARAADMQLVADGAELPAEMGEAPDPQPKFSADSRRIAVQVDQRVFFWDMTERVSLDAAVALPPGTGLLGALPDAPGWIAAEPSGGRAHFVLDADLDRWVEEACRLAGRTLTVTEWRRYLGTEQPYDPACR